MAHHFLSKKIWISVAVVTVLFLALTYAWFFFANQLIQQTEMARIHAITGYQAADIAQDTALAASQLTGEVQKNAENLTAETANTQAEPQEVQYPCYVKMQDDRIGVYSETGELYKTMRQTGEFLSDTDRTQLIQGIQVENEKELIMLCESFHLQ